MNELRAPPVNPTKGPGTIPGERRITYASLLNKPGTDGGGALPPTAITGQKSTTREFLRSKGDGTHAGTPTWDTLLIADVIGDISATRQFAKSVGTGAAGQPATWDTLVAGDIPNLDTSKITTGTFVSARLTGTYAISVSGSSASCTGNAATATTAAACSGNAATATTATNLNGGAVTLGAGSALQLGNAYVAGALVGTGSVIVKDSTGTAYRLVCLV